MALDLETIKTIQGLVNDMNTTITFLSKLREAKEISFTVAGVTTKVNGKTDPEAYQLIFDSLIRSNGKKLSNTREEINKLLYSDDEVMTKAEV